MNVTYLLANGDAHTVSSGRGSQQKTAEELSRAAFSWMNYLRLLCRMLHKISPDMVSATSVTARLDTGTDAEAQLLCEMSRRLAEEFDVDASVQIKEAGFTVRFSRKQGEAEGEDCP